METSRYPRGNPVRIMRHIIAPLSEYTMESASGVTLMRHDIARLCSGTAAAGMPLGEVIGNSGASPPPLVSDFATRRVGAGE